MMWSMMSCWQALMVVVGFSFDRFSGSSSSSARLSDCARLLADDTLKKPPAGAAAAVCAAFDAVAMAGEAAVVARKGGAATTDAGPAVVVGAVWLKAWSMMRLAAHTSNMGMGPKPRGATLAGGLLPPSRDSVAGPKSGGFGRQVGFLVVWHPSASSRRAVQALFVCWSVEVRPAGWATPQGAGEGEGEGDGDESDLTLAAAALPDPYVPFSMFSR
uniref:Secreted protein n=1 Tax=Ixodes ricinus TaxID=34613 RepID=A0A6B0V3W2_IXORI